jgi:TolB protein
MKQIRVMDLEGRDLSYLSSRDAQNLSPVWSPDGDALVYIHGESEQLFDWESGDPSTWGSSLWIAQVETGQYSELVTSEGRACWSPTWLPDGSGVIFVSNRKGQSDVWLVNRDGSSLQQLTDQGNVVALDIF